MDWTFDRRGNASITAYEQLLLLRNATASLSSMSAADSSSTVDSHGNSSQLLVLTGLLCCAVVMAAIVAVVVTSSSTSGGGSKGKSSMNRRINLTAPGEDELTSSAPATRRSSVDKTGARKFASSDQLDRVDIVDDCNAELRDKVEGRGDETVEAFRIDGPVELRFCTKLDLAEGILYLHGFCMNFSTRPSSSQLDTELWRVAIEITDNSGSHRWSIEAGLRRRKPSRRIRPSSVYQTQTIDYVASLRLNGGRLSAQLPHERHLRITAWAADPSRPVRFLLGEFQLPLHLVNEPSMEFGSESAVLEGEGAAPCRQLRPPQLLPPQPSAALATRTPRLHLGLLYSPGALVSSISVRLVEVFDLDDLGSPGHVTASVALAPADQSQSSAAIACLTARPAGSQSTYTFDWSQPAPVLAIDNARLQAAAVGVAVCVAIDNQDRRRLAGRILLSDFALASCSSAMRQWTAAVGRPNAWVWLSHACR